MTRRSKRPLINPQGPGQKRATQKPRHHDPNLPPADSDDGMEDGPGSASNESAAYIYNKAARLSKALAGQRENRLNSFFDNPADDSQLFGGRGLPLHPIPAASGPLPIPPTTMVTGISSLDDAYEDFTAIREPSTRMPAPAVEANAGALAGASRTASVADSQNSEVIVRMRSEIPDLKQDKLRTVKFNDVLEMKVAEITRENDDLKAEILRLQKDQRYSHRSGVTKEGKQRGTTKRGKLDSEKTGLLEIALNEGCKDELRNVCTCIYWPQFFSLLTNWHVHFY